jgi:hypothetical protein
VVEVVHGGNEAGQVGVEGEVGGVGDRDYLPKAVDLRDVACVVRGSVRAYTGGGRRMSPSSSSSSFKRENDETPRLAFSRVGAASYSLLSLS